MTSIGELGEQVVSGWLKAQGWTVLHHRWRCRWGEIDLIVQPPLAEVLAFVEVKTRSSGNWDADGILAITPQKQAKLVRTAALFLAKYSKLATLSCRFDVALVSYKRSFHNSLAQDYAAEPAITIKQPIFWQGYQFTLHHYIEAAFDSDFQVY